MPPTLAAVIHGGAIVFLNATAHSTAAPPSLTLLPPPCIWERRGAPSSSITASSKSQQAAVPTSMGLISCGRCVYPDFE
ncbi:unnamed protein product [Urochloa humidicola]